MAKLGEYVTIRTGKLDANAAIENGKYPFFTCSVIPLRIDNFSYDCECVLVAGNGDLNVKYYNGKFDAYQRTYIIESKNKTLLTVPYLYCFLEKYIETLRKQSIGGIIKYIKLGNLTNAEIPLCGINKQKQITTVLSKLNSVIEIRKKQVLKLDELVKSRFIEMFGDPNINPYHWNILQLGKCIKSIDNGKSFVCNNNPRIGNAPAILKLSAVTYGVYKPEENKAIIDSDDFVKSAEVQNEDLLFTRKNTPDLVGMSSYVFSTPEKLMMPDLIFRINTKEICNKVFLWQFINHDSFRKHIQNIATGSAKSMSNISKERLMKLQIALPPIELQNKFANFVKQVDKSKLAIEKNIEKLEILKKTLMQKYFG